MNNYSSIEVCQDEFNGDVFRNENIPYQNEKELMPKRKIKVARFDTATVCDLAVIKKTATRIRTGFSDSIVVLPAMFESTNVLEKIVDLLYHQRKEEARDLIIRLEYTYVDLISQFYEQECFREKALNYILNCFHLIWRYTKGEFSETVVKDIIAQGELISSELFYLYLEDAGIRATVLPACEFMRLNESGEPDMKYIRSKVRYLMDQNADAKIYFIQGSICADFLNEPESQKKNNCDYFTALIATAISAEEIQVWTAEANRYADREDLKNRIDETVVDRGLASGNAHELARFYIDVLYSDFLMPVIHNHIPVRVLNITDPDSPGFLVSDGKGEDPIKYAVVKEGMMIVKMKSKHIFPAYRFTSHIFGAFEKYCIPVDLSVTSDINIAVVIPEVLSLQRMIDEIQAYTEVSVEDAMSVLSVKCDFPFGNIGLKSMIVRALKEIPLYMISYGDDNRILFLVIKDSDSEYAISRLKSFLAI